MGSPQLPRRAAFIFVFVTVVLDMLALGIMVPVLPKLIVSFEAGDHVRAAQITGYFGFAWALMQFISSPILGSLSDRWGRRPVLLLSSAGLGLDYVLMALAPTLNWLFLGRVLSGITAATFATASAYISDITPPEHRAGRFGMLGAAFGLGFIVGPAVGGLLGNIDLRLPFWVAAACSLLNTIYGAFVLPESLPLEKRHEFRWNVANPWGALQFLRSPEHPLPSPSRGRPEEHPLPSPSRGRPEALGGLAMATFFSALAHESLPSMFVLYTDYRYHWDERTVGLVLGSVGLMSMIVSAGLTRRCVSQLGERKTMLFGFTCGAAGFWCYGAALQPSQFLVGLPLIGLFGLAGPTVQAALSRRVGATQQGQLQGAISSLRGISGMIGPLMFTQSFALATSGAALPAGIPFYIASALLFASLVIAMHATHAKK